MKSESKKLSLLCIPVVSVDSPCSADIIIVSCTFSESIKITHQCYSNY